MKSRYIKILFTLQAVTIAALVSSCSEDFFDRDSFSHSSDNLIKFDVSSGFVSQAASRSSAENNDDADLPPVVFSEGSDTLYIHRYVGLESERATGSRVSAISRGLQINDLGAFKTYCKDFYVQATYADDNSNYIPSSKAEPLTSEQSGDVWYIKDPRYYWPVQRQLLFNAYAPVSAKDLIKGLALGRDIVSFSYAVPVSTDDPRVDAERQPDIMFASTKCSRNDNDSYALLNFRHALSAIKFAVRDVASGEIVDISISGVAGSGSCLFNPEADSAPAFTWSNLGENTAEYKQTFNHMTTESAIDDIPALENATIINDLEGMNDKTFMLIPQDIPDEAQLKITFKKADETIKILKGKLRTSDIPKWEAGKEYVYTISTSADVWDYVFTVTGSIQEEDDANPSAGVFGSDDNSIIINPTVTEGAYYEVKSYRVRKSNPDKKEAVAWTAQSSEGMNQGSEVYSDYIDKYKDGIPSMTLAPTDWFPEIGIIGEEDGSDNLSMEYNGKFGDNGSVEGKKYNVKFKTQYVATNWEADWQMRAYAEYGTESDPIDLSYRNGGNTGQNTANCYIVDRGGWYKFPLVYGNAITNSQKNESAYRYTKDYNSQGYSSLLEFKDYKNQPISSPYIAGAEAASLVWGDAYNIIDQVYLDDSKSHVIFHVARQDLQQSNSVIAVKDASGEIMWSWHIWVTEHWVDNNLGLTRGIVECDTWEADDEAYGPFYVAPVNLGWCDEKNVEYLKRTGVLTFIQNKTGMTKTLNVEQREKKIEFWIGNNTYYQFGRKDPMVGYRNAVSIVKYNFGPEPYETKDGSEITKDGIGGNSIGGSIRHPNVLICRYESGYGDWLSKEYSYYNLWNNYQKDGALVTGDREPMYNFNQPLNQLSLTYIKTKDFDYSAVKTVYDPSPAGFVVPPAAFYSLFTKGRAFQAYQSASDSPDTQGLDGVDNRTTRELGFNGRAELIKDPDLTGKFYKWIAKSKRDGGGEPITLTATGQRWEFQGFGPNYNFNPHFVYMWSNAASFYDANSPTGPTAFSTAIGYEFANGIDKKQYPDITYDPVGYDFIITNHFQGRKSMARPVRCVKEYTPKTLGR